MKATPNGEFLVVAFPSASKIFFFSILQEMCSLRLVEPQVSVSTFFCVNFDFSFPSTPLNVMIS